MKIGDTIKLGAINTDFRDPQQAAIFVNWVAREADNINWVCGKYEDKLKDLLTPEQFEAFIKESAKELFAQEVEELEDEDFKGFIKEHFDEITD